MTYAQFEYGMMWFWAAYLLVLLYGLLWAAWALWWDEPRQKRRLRARLAQVTRNL